MEKVLAKWLRDTPMHVCDFSSVKIVSTLSALLRGEITTALCIGGSIVIARAGFREPLIPFVETQGVSFGEPLIPRVKKLVLRKLKKELARSS